MARGVLQHTLPGGAIEKDLIVQEMVFGIKNHCFSHKSGVSETKISSLI